jgi:hypothetical protein
MGRQDIENLVSRYPQCVLPCLQQAFKSVGCTTDDYDCTCSKYGEVYKSAGTCLTNMPQQCSSDDFQSELGIYSIELSPEKARVKLISKCTPTNTSPMRRSRSDLY